MKQSSIQCLADTGAQTCASGPELLRVLNLHEKYLIPTSHRIVGVTQSFMDIIGVALVQIEVNGRTTNQAVYISKNIKGFFLSEALDVLAFLSEKAHMKLGILPPCYPSPSLLDDKATTSNSCQAAPAETNNQCNCPRGIDPPLPPKGSTISSNSRKQGKA